MSIRFYKPSSSGTRHRSISQFSQSGSSDKKLLYGHHRVKGRNNRGVITLRHRGGGHKRLYRRVDFQRNYTNMYAKVTGIHYDPNRNARIALLTYQNQAVRYILCAHKMVIGQDVISTPTAPVQIGNSLPLANVPLGTALHNIEINPGHGGKFVRAAGAVARLVAKEGKWASVRLPCPLEACRGQVQPDSAKARSPR